MRIILIWLGFSFLLSLYYYISLLCKHTHCAFDGDEYYVSMYTVCVTVYLYLVSIHGVCMMAMYVLCKYACCMYENLLGMYK